MFRTSSLLALLFSLIFALAGRAQEQELSAGRVIERVVCKADSSQSYALYLPSNYTAASKWPIIYCFDPGARGSMPVERFKEAAEKYGYIVAGSNNSRNGPGVPLETIINRLWEDTHARLAIDDARIYAAGFSGGARVACAFGYMFNGKVAGVIASGGGFPQNISPSRSTPFVLFGAAGMEDFNLIEVNRLGKTLTEHGVPNRVEVFEGRHEWLPGETCVEAVEWMEVQAITSGKRKRDDAMIEALYKKRLDRARSHETAGRVYEAYLSYAAAARDFKSLIDVREPEAKSAQLKETQEVRAAIKQEKEQETKQALRARELFGLKRTLTDPENGPEAFRDIKKAIGDLRKKAEEKERTSDQLVARRVLDLLFISVYEEARAWHYEKSYGLEALNLEIAAFVRPENPRILYNLAKAYSLNKEKRKAIDALKAAIARGYKDTAEIERDKELDGLREEAEFKRLVDEMKKS
jgi:poly(3-hydroxybutyrate) depolymerase